MTDLDHGVAATTPDQAPDDRPAGSAGDGQAAKPRRSIIQTLRIEQLSGLYVLALLIVFFGITTGDTFLTMATFRGVLSDQAIVAVASIGLLVAFAAGAFDLSIGAVLGWSLVLVIWLQSEQSMNPFLAIVVTIIVGSLIGIVNGLVVVFLKVNSFIATLAMSSILAAGIQWISGGRQLSSQGVTSTFTDLGRFKIFEFPIPIVYMVVVAVIAWYVLEYTPVGRYLYATGGNEQASRLAGIRTQRYIFGSLAASATIASLAGVFFAARVGSASLTVGPTFLLPAFAAVFLGSTQIKPGRVNVWGTLVAIFLLATGVKGLQLMGAPFWVDSLFNGIVLIAAVALAGLRGKGDVKRSI